MKTAIIATGERAEHHKTWGGAFAEGLKRHGWNVKTQRDSEPSDLLVLWGTRRQLDIRQQLDRGGEVCIIERGYLGNRMHWSSVSFGGGLNGHAEFRGVSGDPRRFDSHFGHLMRPWHRPECGYAMIMGQVPGDMSIKHMDINAFYQQAFQALAKQGWSVRFRAHPLAGRSDNGRAGIKSIKGELYDCLEEAGLVVTFNSNSAVDAALFGRPVIAFDRGSMAWEIAGHQVDEVITPDRTDWAARLAWCQWRSEEIRSGECWEVISQCPALAI